MPDYVRLALEWLQHRIPTAKNNSPHECKETLYGLKKQYANNPDTLPLLYQ